jgi:hypothetical protein
MKGTCSSITKKEFAPREVGEAPGGPTARGPAAVTARRVLHQGAGRVAGCWSVGGLVCLKETSNPGVVVKIKNIYEPIDAILAYSR